MTKSYPEKYAITIRDTDKLFLMFVINRSTVGDVYVNFNERDTQHKPHSSYHGSGQLHHKGYNKKLFPLRKKQAPTGSFKGTETIITTSIRKGDARAWNVSCEPGDYDEIMEIKDDIITPEFGYQFSVELVEPGVTPWISKYQYARVIQQQIFKQGTPWIVASLYEMSGTPFHKLNI